MGTGIRNTSYTHFSVSPSIKLQFDDHGIKTDFLNDEVFLDKNDLLIKNTILVLLSTDTELQKAILKYYLVVRLHTYLIRVAPDSLASLSCNSLPICTFFFINSAFYFRSYPAFDQNTLCLFASQSIREAPSKLILNFRNFPSTYSNHPQVRGLRSYPLNEFFIAKNSKLLANKFNNFNSMPVSPIARERNRISFLRTAVNPLQILQTLQLFNAGGFSRPFNNRQSRSPKLLTMRLYMRFLQISSSSSLNRQLLYHAACSALSVYAYTFYARRHRRAAATLYLSLRS